MEFGRAGFQSVCHLLHFRPSSRGWMFVLTPPSPSHPSIPAFRLGSRMPLIAENDWGQGPAMARFSLVTESVLGLFGSYNIRAISNSRVGVRLYGLWGPPSWVRG